MALTQEGVKFSDFVRGLPAATEADLAAGNNMPIVSASDIKKMGGENVAKYSNVTNLQSVVRGLLENGSSFSIPDRATRGFVFFDADGVIKQSSTNYSQLGTFHLMKGECISFFFKNDSHKFGFCTSDVEPVVGSTIDIIELDAGNTNDEYYRVFCAEKDIYLCWFAWTTVYSSNSTQILKFEAGDVLKDIPNKLEYSADDVNLCNDGDIEWGKYLNGSGDVLTTSSQSFGVTPMYPVSHEGVCFRSCNNATFATATIYNKDKQKIRYLIGNASYQYQEGDAYIRFHVIRSANYPFQANYGSLLNCIGNDYSVYASRYLSGIKNGRYNQLKNTFSVHTVSDTVVVDYAANSFYVQQNASTSSSFNIWTYFERRISNGDGVLNIDSSRKLKIEFDLVIDSLDLGSSFALWISNGPSSTSGQYEKLLNANTNKHISIEVDTAYYTQYKGWNEFNFWFALNGAAVGLHKITISNLEVFQYRDGAQFTNFAGNNAEQLFKGVDEKFNEIIGKKGEYIVSPDLQKFTMAIDNDGNVFGIPLYPRKAAFIGNSLIAGNGFGMNASSSQKDYYYLVTEFIKLTRPELVASRLSGGNFESSESISAARAQIQNLVDQIDAQSDFVCIQLGDNVNTDAKKNVFDTSCGELIAAIRNKAPRAKIVWMGIWYSDTRVSSRVQAECLAKGVQFVGISGFNVPDNKSYIGAVIEYASSSSRSVSNVTEVIANTSTNITVKFVVSGNNYESTFDVDSYSLNGSTLSYVGRYGVTTSSGVASHPGDNGFRLIANKLIYSVGMTDDEEYYKET